MDVFMECGSCHKKWHITVNGSLTKTICPHCDNDQMCKVQIGGGNPEWFNQDDDEVAEK